VEGRVEVEVGEGLGLAWGADAEVFDAGGLGFFAASEFALFVAFFTDHRHGGLLFEEVVLAFGASGHGVERWRGREVGGRRVREV